MRKITGKLLELILFTLCFALFIIVLPEWLCLTLVGIGMAICVAAMISANFFGKF